MTAAPGLRGRRAGSARRVGPDRRPGLGGVLALAGLGLVAATAAGHATRHRPERHPRHDLRPDRKREALRLARDGAAILGASVLADSAMEHFRGGFHRPEMYAAPAAGALAVAAALADPRRDRGGLAIQAAHAGSLAVGTAGLAYHFWNIWKRPGRFNWNNLFHAAPPGAPGALATTGLIGMLTHRMAQSPGGARRHGRQLAALSGVALAGDTAEAWLLHFRGAFHDPFMVLPVTLPPIAAAGLLAQALRPRPALDRGLRVLLRAVEALGVVGTGLHGFGVSRCMGGWANWRQTTLSGPPMPAPISFTGLARTGRAALDLIAAAAKPRALPPPSPAERAIADTRR